MYKIGDKIKIVDRTKIRMFPDDSYELESEYEVLDITKTNNIHFITIDLETCSDYPIYDHEFDGIELIERPEAFKSYQKSQQLEFNLDDNLCGPKGRS